MKNTLILAVLLFAIKTITAQDNNSFREKEFSLIVGPSYTNIKNGNLSSDKYASSKGTDWFNAGITYNKYFSKNFGMILGLEYSRYSNVTSYQGAFRSSDKRVDRDGYVYYPVSEADYKDTRTIQSIDLPIGLRLQVPVNKSVDFFVDFGVRLNFIAKATLHSHGTLNKKGAYPNINYDNVFILIEDDSYYGYTNSTYASYRDMGVQRVGASYFIGCGIKANVGERSFILINPCYMQGISDIMNKDNRTDYKNIFDEASSYKAFKLSQFAIRIGIGFEI